MYAAPRSFNHASANAARGHCRGTALASFAAGSLMYTPSLVHPVTTTRCPSVPVERGAGQRAGRESDTGNDRQATFESGRRCVEAVKHSTAPISPASVAARIASGHTPNSPDGSCRLRARRRPREASSRDTSSTIAMLVGEQMRYRSAVGAVSWLIGGTTRRWRDSVPGVAATRNGRMATVSR